MSWPALKWARKQHVGSASAKSILIFLSIYADDDGYCWPSQETLGGETELSVDTVQRALKLLVPRFAERIKRKSADGRRISDAYRLNLRGETFGTVAPAPPRGPDKSGMDKSSNRVARTPCAKPQTDQPPPSMMRPKYNNKQNEDSCPFSETVAGRWLQTRIGHLAFGAWFSGIRWLGKQGDTIELEAQSLFIANRIEQWYEPDIIKCFRDDREGAVRVKVLVASPARAIPRQIDAAGDMPVKNGSA